MKFLVQRSVCLVLCCVLLLFAASLLRCQASAVEVLIGDVNGNNEVNVCDVARLYAHFRGKSLVGQDTMDRADLDGLGWLYPRYTDELYAQIRGISAQQLLQTFRQLPENTQMDGTVTLTGVVVAIKECYNPEFDNISVTIQVKGWQGHILCYRMIGDRMASVSVSDQIEVTGTICKRRGGAEFTAGCHGVITTEWSTAQSYHKSIVERINNLPVNASSRSEISMTGQVIAMTSDVSQITVTIRVSGCKNDSLRCIYMTEAVIPWLGVGKWITVSGIIRNNNGIVEFAPGCRLASAS